MNAPSEQQVAHGRPHCAAAQQAAAAAHPSSHTSHLLRYPRFSSIAYLPYRRLTMLPPDVVPQLDPGTSKYFVEAKKYFDEYLEGSITHTDCGSAYPYHWGSLTHGSNVGEYPAPCTGAWLPSAATGRAGLQRAAGIWLRRHSHRVAQCCCGWGARGLALHACMCVAAPPTPAHGPAVRAVLVPQPPWACSMPGTRPWTATLLPG